MFPSFVTGIFWCSSMDDYYAIMLVIFIPSPPTPHGCTCTPIAVLHGPLWLLPLSCVATHAFHTFSSSVINHNTKVKWAPVNLPRPPPPHQCSMLPSQPSSTASISANMFQPLPHTDSHSRCNGEI